MNPAPDGPTPSTPAEAAPNYLICRSGASHAALPLKRVVETLRPLPVEALADMPEFLLGLSTIRGESMPVVHLGRLIGPGREGRPARFVRLKLDERGVALAVDEVLGLRLLADAELAELPPLLRGAGAVDAIATLDNTLLLVLRGVRLLPDTLWHRIASAGSRS